MCKHCWSDDETEHHKDFIRGGVPPEYGEAEVNYRPKKKKPRRRSTGCPGNDGGAHVYVWVESDYDDLFKRYFGFSNKEKKVCCGCLKSARRFRDSEKYTRKFGKHKLHKYDHPEYRHEGFREYRRKWLVQHGYTHEYYGSLF